MIRCIHRGCATQTSPGTNVRVRRLCHTVRGRDLHYTSLVITLHDPYSTTLQGKWSCHHNKSRIEHTYGEVYNPARILNFIFLSSTSLTARLTCIYPESKHTQKHSIVFNKNYAYQANPPQHFRCSHHPHRRHPPRIPRLPRLPRLPHPNTYIRSPTTRTK